MLYKRGSIGEDRVDILKGAVKVNEMEGYQ